MSGNSNLGPKFEELKGKLEKVLGELQKIEDTSDKFSVVGSDDCWVFENKIVVEPSLPGYLNGIISSIKSDTEFKVVLSNQWTPDLPSVFLMTSVGLDQYIPNNIQGLFPQVDWKVMVEVGLLISDKSEDYVANNETIDNLVKKLMDASTRDISSFICINGTVSILNEVVKMTNPSLVVVIEKESKSIKTIGFGGFIDMTISNFCEVHSYGKVFINQDGGENPYISSFIAELDHFQCKVWGFELEMEKVEFGYMKYNDNLYEINLYAKDVKLVEDCYLTVSVTYTKDKNSNKKLTHTHGSLSKFDLGTLCAIFEKLKISEGLNVDAISQNGLFVMEFTDTRMQLWEDDFVFSTGFTLKFGNFLSLHADEVRIFRTSRVDMSSLQLSLTGGNASLYHFEVYDICMLYYRSGGKNFEINMQGRFKVPLFGKDREFMVTFKRKKEEVAEGEKRVSSSFEVGVIYEGFGGGKITSDDKQTSFDFDVAKFSITDLYHMCFGDGERDSSFDLELVDARIHYSKLKGANKGSSEAYFSTKISLGDSVPKSVQDKLMNIRFTIGLETTQKKKKVTFSIKSETEKTEKWDIINIDTPEIKISLDANWNVDIIYESEEGKKSKFAAAASGCISVHSAFFSMENLKATVGFDEKLSVSVEPQNITIPFLSEIVSLDSLHCQMIIMEGKMTPTLREEYNLSESEETLVDGPGIYIFGKIDENKMSGASKAISDGVSSVLGLSSGGGELELFFANTKEVMKVGMFIGDATIRVSDKCDLKTVQIMVDKSKKSAGVGVGCAAIFSIFPEGREFPDKRVKLTVGIKVRTSSKGMELSIAGTAEASPEKDTLWDNMFGIEGLNLGSPLAVEADISPSNVGIGLAACIEFERYPKAIELADKHILFLEFAFKISYTHVDDFVYLYVSELDIGDIFLFIERFTKGSVSINPPDFIKNLVKIAGLNICIAPNGEAHVGTVTFPKGMLFQGIVLLQIPFLPKIEVFLKVHITDSGFEFVFLMERFSLFSFLELEIGDYLNDRPDELKKVKDRLEQVEIAGPKMLEGREEGKKSQLATQTAHVEMQKIISDLGPVILIKANDSGIPEVIISGKVKIPFLSTSITTTLLLDDEGLTFNFEYDLFGSLATKVFAEVRKDGHICFEATMASLQHIILEKLNSLIDSATNFINGGLESGVNAIEDFRRSRNQGEVDKTKAKYKQLKEDMKKISDDSIIRYNEFNKELENFKKESSVSQALEGVIAMQERLIEVNERMVSSCRARIEEARKSLDEWAKVKFDLDKELKEIEESRTNDDVQEEQFFIKWKSRLNEQRELYLKNEDNYKLCVESKEMERAEFFQKQMDINRTTTESMIQTMVEMKKNSQIERKVGKVLNGSYKDFVYGMVTQCEETVKRLDYQLPVLEGDLKVVKDYVFELRRLEVNTKEEMNEIFKKSLIEAREAQNKRMESLSKEMEELKKAEEHEVYLAANERHGFFDFILDIGCYILKGCEFIVGGVGEAFKFVANLVLTEIFSCE